MPKVFSSSETKDLKVLDNPAVVSAALRYQRARVAPRRKLTPETPLGPVLPVAAVHAQDGQHGEARQESDYAAR